MSTVVGLIKKEQSLTVLTDRLASAGCGLEQVKVLTNPREVHALLDKNALAKCQMSRCAGTGALLGLMLFAPVGFMAAAAGCMVFGCQPLVWLFTFGGLSFIGGIFGAMFGCFFGGDRFERNEHLYAEGVGWGHKLVVINADTAEAKTSAERVLQQEQAIGVKVFDDET
jgi:hypothetical protein